MLELELNGLNSRIMNPSSNMSEGERMVNCSAYATMVMKWSKGKSMDWTSRMIVAKYSNKDMVVMLWSKSCSKVMMVKLKELKLDNCGKVMVFELKVVNGDEVVELEMSDKVVEHEHGKGSPHG